MRQGKRKQIGRKANSLPLMLVAAAMAVVSTQVWTQSPAAPAQPASNHETDWANCQSSTPDIALKGCSAIIDADAGSAAELAVAYNNRGTAYYGKGDLDRAIDDFSEAIQLRPDYSTALNNRGCAHAAKHDYEPAILDFNRAIRIKPGLVTGRDGPTLNVAAVLKSRGNAYIHAHENNLAILDFTEAIRMRPDDADAYYYRGAAYAAGSNFDEAIDNFSKSLQLKPGNAYVLYARGVARQNLHDGAGAEADKTAARQIDPSVAGKTAGLTAPSGAVATSAAPAQLLPSTYPSCGGLSDELLGLTPATSSKHIAPVTTYVDESEDELKRASSTLRGIRFKLMSNGAAAGTSQVTTESILDRTGVVTADLLHRIPNLLAREEVEQTTGNTLESDSGSLAAKRRQMSVGIPIQEIRIRNFGYRIVHEKTNLGDDADIIDEYRTDAHDRPIQVSKNDPDAPRTTGFATSWLFFVPSNLPQSRFRYLGQQKVNNHETYVVAFAQIPAKTNMDTIVHSPTGPCSTFSQGLAWIDQSTFQIVRMQTDLLAPLPGIELNELRSLLNYGEVKIPRLNLSLWLPSDVETTWISGDHTGDETHRYSNYKLFASTVTILPSDPTPPR
jgi:tetratricopeptide (TPR) repeat protein